ncbi:uncharacterized protein EAE98_000025 [Botrytis deweyae]|uniref:Cytochrome P450 n=1 Tax=Botrytis deweyae TaxID=2478750 RepID=A0ABQ7J1H7_9HELO|nr:uncharacterized protein EAE98_000025 [Botrytis deweyae]KAF7939898.1 hypothetical protein EAE98_000025 [Botrytis deweyae]
MATVEIYLLFAIIGVSFTLLTRAFCRGSSSNSREPPEIKPTIPYIGHALGLFWYRSAYYTKICQTWKAPIISIPMFGGKVHIVGSPELISSLQRQGKTASFWYLEARFTAELGGLSRNGMKKLVANLEPASEKPSLLIEGLKATQQAISPLGGVDDMIRVAAENIQARLDNLASETGDIKLTTDLWAWVQHEITVATTESVYGPENPYRDSKVETGFWDFANDNVTLLLTKLLPNFVASKAIRGRAIVVEAMSRYFTKGAQKNGSSLVKARYASLSPEMSHDDLARFECVDGIAIMTNTVPAAFWTVFQIFSDPELLKQVRDQVREITTTTQSQETGILELKINLRRLKDAPILFSAQQETLRFRATGTQPRMVMEDMIVGDDEYLLRKDSMVIIANRALHYDKKTWGETADVFRAHRFCGKVPGHAFRGFGGGINLCPGRGFAMAEVAALVAMLAMRFDLVPVGGNWVEPGQDLNNMSLQVAPPGRKVMVSIVPREGSGGQKWSFE